jgi:group II intron reverse transcriptase/maturase
MQSLAHHLDVAALGRSYSRLKPNAAVGVDGVTVQAYGHNLKANLQQLHVRLQTKRYRHQPIRRIHIPKDNGKTRPIGISTTEDKIVQGALHELLEAIYEQDFEDFSYGFRPGRSTRDALRNLNGAMLQGRMQWVLELDIASFFDSLVRAKLVEMLQERIADRSVIRLIGKCLHVGVLEGEVFCRPDEGTVQGSRLSPLLGNIYLHHVLDRWFVDEVRPRMKGRAAFVRYADDAVFCFERRSDAERVMAVLGERAARFGLALHPDKTRLLDFRRPPEAGPSGKRPESFDFLGFTMYWRRSRKGRWYVASKTRHARVQRAKRTINDWCRCHRHWPVKDQHAALVRRIQGHINYFGVRGNTRSLGVVVEAARRAWFKWLNRRSQRSRLNWERYADLLRDFPLPKPKAKWALWGSPL